MAVRLIQFTTILLAIWWTSIATAQAVVYQVNSNGQVAQATYSNGTVVTYRYDASGNRVGATVTPDTTPPSTPGTPSASSITSNSATITWGAATDSIAITGYSYQVNGGLWSSFSNVMSVNLVGLSYSANYTVGVRAQDVAGNIGPTATGSFTTAADTTPPGAPGIPTFSNVTFNSATASWTAATDPVGVTGYSYEVNGGSWSSFANVLSVNLTGLAWSTSYVVGVRAQDSAGNIGATVTGSFATPADTTPPGEPGIPTATNITYNSATVNWTAASDPAGVIGYSYQVNGGSWTSFSNVLSVNLTGLTYSTLYTVSVRAEDTAGNIGSAASGSFTMFRDTNPPSAPGTPTFSSITGLTATASWTAATDLAGVSGYSYQINGGSWSSFTNVLSVNLTGLTSGTAYTLAVRAQDSVGNIGATVTASFTTTTPVLTPTHITVPPVGSTGFFLEYGYPVGSITPNVITGPLVFNEVVDLTGDGTIVSQVAISGFTANPGQGWLTSVKIGSTSKTGSSASTFGYGAGIAIWSWTTNFGIGSTPVNIVVTHQ